MGETRYYLAYGSNLNIQEMKRRCPLAGPIGVTSVPGYGLLFKKGDRGTYLTIEPAEGESVPAAVWEVTGEEEEALDQYEDYPELYYKKEMEVSVTDRTTGICRRVSAFVYIMHEYREKGTPDEEYLAVCREGYRDFGFHESSLENALEKSRN